MPDEGGQEDQAADGAREKGRGCPPPAASLVDGKQERRERGAEQHRAAPVEALVRTQPPRLRQDEPAQDRAE